MNNDQQLANDALDIIAAQPADKRAGTQAGEISMSYLLARLQEKGWKGISTSGWGSGNLHDLLPRLGFRVISRKAGRSTRHIVTV